VIPLAPGRTLVRTTWLVHANAVEGVGYDLDTLTKVWEATNEQDAVFVTRAQLGISSPAYVPGPVRPDGGAGRGVRQLVRDPAQGTPVYLSHLEQQR
jgi:glycine betaine catabolism A